VEIVDVEQDAFGDLQNFAPGRRQTRDAVARPAEYFYPEFFFDFLQLPADARLRLAQRIGRGRDFHALPDHFVDRA